LKILTALTGFGLIIAGLALVAVEFIEPQQFAQIYKDLSGIGFQLHASAIGFGVLVVGAALLAVASSGTTRGDDL
jgi:hypothetical protein